MTYCLWKWLGENPQSCKWNEESCDDIIQPDTLPTLRSLAPDNSHAICKGQRHQKAREKELNDRESKDKRKEKKGTNERKWCLFIYL
jgi:hypothetical protein